MTTRQIALRLITLCKDRKFSEARNELYAENAISIGADNKPITGLQAMDEKEKIGMEAFRKFTKSNF